MNLLIGTSGYNYKHWRNGVFYPKGIRETKLLEYYQKYFNSVELNVTFYRLPSEKVFASWYKKSKKDFGFVIKGSRFITHIKRLKDVHESLELFSKRCGYLREKLLCVLWQLPPSMKIDLERLGSFLKEIKNNDILRKIDHSIEFRHESWFENESLELLKKNNISLCIAHSQRWPFFERITSDFLYLRFHGGESLYSSEYSMDELKNWSEKIKKWQENYKLRRIYVFFNNDAYGFAVRNALQLKKFLIE